MKLIIAMTALLFAFGCGEDENVECTSTVTCNDDKEMLCDEPTSTVLEDGTTLEVRACTYVTYEHCFEKVECKPRG